MTSPAPRTLAIEGGLPAFPEGPPPWPLAEAGVAEALQAVAADGSWGRYFGGHVDRLIASLAELLGIDHVYPCCSGTFAVELGLRMLKVGPGDEVILAAYDFAGNFRAIEAVGASPVLVDIVPCRWHLDPAQLAAVEGPKVKAVIVSHLHGVNAPLPEIAAIAEKRGWQVLEDACQASGATIEGRAAGTWGHVGTLSFGGSKLLTAGRGGAVLARDPQLVQRAKVHCEQGNHAFPLSELQACVLLPQLATLAERTCQRLRGAQRLIGPCQTGSSDFRGGSLVPSPLPANGDLPAFYKLGWLVSLPGDEPEFTRTAQLRDRLAAALQAEGLAIDAGFRGLGRRSEARCRKVGDLANARQAAAGTLVLHHPLLLADDAALDRAGRTIAEVAQAIFQRFHEEAT
jgi:perosamine synthetase